VTVLVLLCAYGLFAGAANVDQKVKNVPLQKNILNKRPVASGVVLDNFTRNTTHEAKINSSTAQAQKLKTSNVTIAGQATNFSPLVATQQRQLQLEKALNVTDKEVKAKLKELKVQSTLVKEKKDAVNQEQKQVDEMRVQREKLQKEAEVAADIAKEKSEAAAKLWKKERAAASQAEDLQAEENETFKFLEQTQKEEASLEHVLAGLHGQLGRIRASPPSLKKILIPVPHKQQLVANRTHSSTPNRNVSVNGMKAMPRLRAGATGPAAASPTSAGNSTAFTPEGKKETLSKAMKQIQAENERLKQEKEELAKKLQLFQEKDELRLNLKQNERLKHEKEELAKKLQLFQEKDELRFNLKQRLLKKEQRSLAVKKLVKKS